MIAKCSICPLRYCTLVRYHSLASSMMLMSTIGFSTNSFHNRGCYGAHVPNMLFLLFLESSDLRGSSMPILVAVWVYRHYEAHDLDMLIHLFIPKQRTLRGTRPQHAFPSVLGIITTGDSKCNNKGDRGGQQARVTCEGSGGGQRAHHNGSKNCFQSNSLVIFDNSSAHNSAKPDTIWTDSDREEKVETSTILPWSDAQVILHLQPEIGPHNLFEAVFKGVLNILCILLSQHLNR